MGLTERFTGLTNSAQQSIKAKAIEMVITMIRWASGLTIGLTLSLIFQEILGYEQFVFIFVLLTAHFLFLKISKSWSLVFLLVFDLICMLVAMLLRMYILVAPG